MKLILFLSYLTNIALVASEGRDFYKSEISYVNLAIKFADIVLVYYVA